MRNVANLRTDTRSRTERDAEAAPQRPSDLHEEDLEAVAGGRGVPTTGYFTAGTDGA